MARLSQELATIHTDVPLPYSPTDLAPRPRDAARLTALFQDLEFGSLTRQFAAAYRSRSSRLSARPLPRRVRSSLCQSLQTLERFAIDTETTALEP